MQSSKHKVLKSTISIKDKDIMTLYTSLQEFKVDPFIFHNKDELKSHITDISEVLHGFNFTLATSSQKPDQVDAGQSFCLFYATPDNSQCILRGYPPDLLTIDINEYVAKGKQPTFSDEITESIKCRIAKISQSKRHLSLPPIRRGQDVQVYFPTANRNLVEYDFDRCVFEADSDYQNIKIMHSLQFGNMLLLDNDPNLAESDLAYTHAITGYDHEDYKDKIVLILGGGDGGILHELRKQNPKYITMVDIDGIVVEQARKHLRGICYDSLDNLTGENYEVLIADCVPILKQYISENKKFDFVINDLTAIPVTTEPVGDHWNFLRLILDLSMHVLAPTGKYYTQGNGANMTNALQMYEEQLKKLQCSVNFKKKTVCVPSYHELWVFYEIWKYDAEEV